MYGATQVMRDTFKMISRVGRTDVTVLVTGESGTGKELVARALHEESGRAQQAVHRAQLLGAAVGAGGERAVRTYARARSPAP